MTGTISMSTAERIWRAHKEIETAHELLEIVTAIAKPTPDLPQGDLRIELAVPGRSMGKRLGQVQPSLARIVIEAQIEAMRLELIEATQRAMEEADDDA